MGWWNWWTRYCRYILDNDNKNRRFYFELGLGGIGGPYRLDAGHQVYQVPDDVKAAVPEHIRKAAKELGQKVFKERLKEIEMSEYEHETYEKYLNKISSEIKMLRSIIESLEAKSHDRQWVVREFPLIKTKTNEFLLASSYYW